MFADEALRQMRGEGLGQRWQYMFTKWRLSCRVQCKKCEGGFSFLSLHLGSKCTFEGLTNKQEMARQAEPHKHPIYGNLRKPINEFSHGYHG